MNSSDLLDEIDKLIIGHQDNIKILKGIRNRIRLGEELPEGLKPIKEKHGK